MVQILHKGLPKFYYEKAPKKKSQAFNATFSSTSLLCLLLCQAHKVPVARSCLFINKSVTFLILTMTALDGYARTNQGEGEGRGGGGGGGRDGRKIARTFATTFKESFSHHLPSLNFSCHGGFRVGMLEVNNFSDYLDLLGSLRSSPPSRW